MLAADTTSVAMAIEFNAVLASFVDGVLLWSHDDGDIVGLWDFGSSLQGVEDGWHQVTLHAFNDGRERWRSVYVDGRPTMSTATAYNGEICSSTVDSIGPAFRSRFTVSGCLMGLCHRMRRTLWPTLA